MTAHLIPLVECDGCGRTQQLDNGSIAQLRASLARAGWTSNAGGNDACPDCLKGAAPVIDLATELPIIIVRCPDGQVRHAHPFPSVQDAFDWAGRGHPCREASKHRLEVGGIDAGPAAPEGASQ